MDLAQTILDIKRKLDKMSEPKPVWVNAETIKKVTGLDKNGLETFRKNNRHLLKRSKKQSVLYNISAIPEILKKQSV